MARVPEAKRVRTQVINGAITAAAGVAGLETLGSHVFQDDVKIIGVQLLGRWTCLDALSNTDGGLVSELELTRAASRLQPASIIGLNQALTWNGVLCIGGDLCKDEIVMFGNDAGIEVDEGEYVNLIVAVSYIGGAASTTFDGTAIIYYVER